MSRAILLLAVAVLAGCAAKPEPEAPKTMEDVKLPPGQEFGYKPPTK